MRKILYAAGVSVGLWASAARRGAVACAAASKRTAVRLAVWTGPVARWFAAGLGVGVGVNAAGGAGKIEPSVIFTIAVTALPLAAATAFCYVLFRFLAVLVQTDKLAAADLAEAGSRVRRALGGGLAGPAAVPNSEPLTPSGGSFNANTEENLYIREQLEALGQAGVLHGADIDDILANGHDADFDFEKFKQTARGENS